MALIRANNKTIQNVTTLPTGITEYNLLGTDLPSGSVLQVVSGEYSTESDTGSTSYVDTGLQASITPSSTSSKILILVSLASSGAFESSGTAANAAYRILKNGTTQVTQVWHRVNDYGGSGVFSFSNHAINYLDSPETTSATTYKVQHKLGNGDSSRVQNDNGGGSKSYITLLEIAG